MTNKEKIEALDYIWFYEPTCKKDVDKRKVIIEELTQDLEMLDYLLWLIEVKEFKDTAHYGKMYLTIRPDAIISQEILLAIKERKEG